jgi:hypothetical protein
MGCVGLTYRKRGDLFHQHTYIAAIICNEDEMASLTFIDDGGQVQKLF